MSSDPPEINPDDLEPTIDIDLKLQKKILQLHAILGTADHYTLLGLDPSAEKKEIRSAYFERMNLFHSDKFYGKNIGKFGPKLQQIVQTLTKASDTLSRKKTKAEYDAYLASRQTTLGARTSIAPRARSAPPEGTSSSRPSRPAVAPIDVVPQIPKAPKAPTIANAAEGVGESSKPPSSPRSGSGRGPASKDAARRMLARKMGRRAAGRAGVPASARTAPAAESSLPPEQIRQAVEADLRKRYDARKNPGRAQVEKYVQMAEAAVAQGDWSSAVSAIRTAAQACPDDADLQNRQSEIQQLADKALAPRFLEQARYEEKDGRPERAARSYERAARGKNSAELFEKAARCLLKLGHLNETDKRKLVEMARKSVTLDNRAADYRLTLARAYDVAGMRTSAQGEVRRALELEPNNKDAKELQKALK